jgi:type II secretory pathway component GspD/PulD (secretin)
VGERFPLLTATFSNIGLAGQSASVVNTPQFTYTDLGLSLNIKPHYLSEDEVRLEFEFEIQGLGTASLNNVPELTSRSFKGTITAKAGEPTVITGQILNNNTKDRTHNQILIVLTPHVVRRPFHDQGTTVWWNAPNVP